MRRDPERSPPEIATRVRRLVDGMRAGGLALAVCAGLVTAAGAAQTDGLMRLADAYLEGEVVPFDGAAAYRYFSEAARRGDQAAALRLAELTLRGIGVERDVDGAMTEIRRLADEGSNSALISLGDAYVRALAGTFDPAASRSAWETAAANGRTDAMLRLADYHRYGILAPADPARAYDYLKAAYEGGNTYALYLMGRGLTEKDFGPAGTPAEGIAMLEDARARGIADAELTLAISRIAGSGVKADPKQGLADLEAMSAAGNLEATLRLVDIYREGFRVDRRMVIRANTKKAREILGAVSPRLNIGERTRQEILMKVAENRSQRYEGLPEDLGRISPYDRPGTLRRILRINENAFVLYVQARLTDFGYYQGRIDGQLTGATIRAVNAYCGAIDAGSFCADGPLSSRGAYVLSNTL
jgi:TPR repeat protein